MCLNDILNRICLQKIEMSRYTKEKKVVNEPLVLKKSSLCKHCIIFVHFPFQKFLRTQKLLLFNKQSHSKEAYMIIVIPSTFSVNICDSRSPLQMLIKRLAKNRNWCNVSLYLHHVVYSIAFGLASIMT